jgi:hypothetical protein
MVKKGNIVCPFSKVACRECAIYRGRHIDFCALPKYRVNGTRPEHHGAAKNQVLLGWDFPETIGTNPNTLVDIEDDFI